MECALLPGAVMKQLKLRETDLEKLGRLAIFSWLKPAEIGLLGASLEMSNFERGEVIFGDPRVANGARVLVTGIVRVTCLDGSHERVTVALVAPGPIPELPSLSMSRFDFRFEAYNRCRVGNLDWSGFGAVTSDGREAAFRRFHQNDLRYWYRLVGRTSAFLSLDLHERIALTILDLSEDFGVEDSRGTMLTVSFSHADIASIVGASRPRVTEHLGQMERDHILIRQGRRLIVSIDKLSSLLPRRIA
jgi:CRP/FNR family transcriptional regulator, cyclic AMP receptor protein